MLKKDQSDHPIIKQIYRAIALNREPGLHFCGNFFALTFDEVHPEHSVLHIDSEVYTRDDDGQMNIAVFAMLEARHKALNRVPRETIDTSQQHLLSLLGGGDLLVNTSSDHRATAALRRRPRSAGRAASPSDLTATCTSPTPATTVSRF